MSARTAHITRITQVTLKMINDAFLVEDLWLGFVYFKILANFAANKYWLYSFLHLYAKTFELFLNITTLIELFVKLNRVLIQMCV